MQGNNQEITKLFPFVNMVGKHGGVSIKEVFRKNLEHN